MSTILIVALVVYVLVAIGFLIAMYREAGKFSAEIGVVHYLVAFIWPLWGIWYVALLIGERFSKR